MADLLKVVVTGASGRMGQTLINLITSHNEIELVGALEHPKHHPLLSAPGSYQGQLAPLILRRFWRVYRVPLVTSASARLSMPISRRL